MPYISIALVCLFISFIMGYLGRNKTMGFWGYFFASLFLTPFIGGIMLVVSDKKKSDVESSEEKG